MRAAGQGHDGVEQTGHVVGDRRVITDEPGRASALFEEIGEVSHLDVADMTKQVRERNERLAEPDGELVEQLRAVIDPLVDEAAARPAAA